MPRRKKGGDLASSAAKRRKQKEHKENILLEKKVLPEFSSDIKRHRVKLKYKMSDMMLNDSVPVDKKWSELIKYNIFIMKLVEFVISIVITLLPLIIGVKPKGHMYCISTGPTTVISFIFIILYLRRKVPLFMEKMYLFFQILFTFGAFLQCFLLNLVRVWLWLIYGIGYFILLTVLCLDFYLIANERGCTFSCA